MISVVRCRRSVARRPSVVEEAPQSERASAPLQSLPTNEVAIREGGSQEGKSSSRLLDLEAELERLRAQQQVTKGSPRRCSLSELFFSVWQVENERAAKLRKQAAASGVSRIEFDA